jgi:hypothetical protein
MMKISTGQLAVAILVLVVLASKPMAALADDPPTPAVGAVVLEDALAGPTLFQPFTCQTGHGGWEYVDDGMRISLTGACSEGDGVAAIAVPLRGLTMIDGEVSIQARLLTGAERVRIGINTRAQPAAPRAPRAGHAAAFEPGGGRGFVGPTLSTIRQVDLGSSVAKDDWNTLAIRLQGPNVWLLVNDQPAAFISDGSVDRGDVLLNFVRLNGASGGMDNDPDDSSEVAAAFRNLRVSALADGDPTRAPIYQKP